MNDVLHAERWMLKNTHWNQSILLISWLILLGFQVNVKKYPLKSKYITDIMINSFKFSDCDIFSTIDF